MTPGTAAARRKTVTFGDYVADNAKSKVKEGSKTGLPADFPGKFPSPWVQPADKIEDAGTPYDRKRGRSKLTEDLHKARDESAKKKATENGNQRNEEPKLGEQNCSGADEPDSESGRYWKREYDIYRENTTREMKKLIAKQRAAKSFAREKDLHCTELADQLRQEKRKVEKLEAQLKVLQGQADDARSASPARNARSSARRSVLVGEGATTAARPAHSRSRSTDQPSTKTPDEEIVPDSPEIVSRRARTRKQSVDLHPEPNAARSRTRHQPGNLPSDLWSHSLAAEGPVTPSKADVQTGNTRSGRAVTSGTNLTPLKSLSINAQHKDRTSQQESPQRSPDAERPPASTPAFLRDNPTLAPPGKEAKDQERCDSFDFKSEMKAEPLSQKPISNRSPLLPSSSFDLDGRAPSSTTTATNKSLPARPIPSGRADSKENVSPSRAPIGGSSSSKDAPIPSQASRVGATSAPIRAKDGTEVSEDRLAAAKARLAARGRKIL